MKESADPTILALLGILVAILTALVGAIYLTVRKDQKETDDRVEVQRVESDRRHEKNAEAITAALKETNDNHESLRKELMDEIKSAVDDREKTNREQWVEINLLKDRYHGINTQHLQWCQKHEDQLNALGEKVHLYDSKLKGQGDFFNQRTEEIKKKLSGMQQKITGIISVNNLKDKKS